MWCAWKSDTLRVHLAVMVATLESKVVDCQLVQPWANAADLRVPPSPPSSSTSTTTKRIAVSLERASINLQYIYTCAAHLTTLMFPLSSWIELVSCKIINKFMKRTIKLAMSQKLVEKKTNSYTNTGTQSGKHGFCFHLGNQSIVVDN